MFIIGVFFVIQVFAIDAISEVTILPTKCGTTEVASTGQILVGVSGGIYSETLENCTYTITAASTSHRLRFAFNTGNTDNSTINNPNVTGCGGASVEIFNGPNITSPSLTGQLCGSLAADERLSTSDTLTLLLSSTGGNDTVFNFTAHYTSFKEGDCGSDFMCSNGRCIAHSFLCDSTLVNNCGDFSDNSKGPPANCTDDPETTTVMVTTAVLASMATNPEAIASESSPIWIAYIAAGLIGLYFLHWLLFKPGWLVWRMGCFRHMRCCSKCYNLSGKNSVEAQRPLTDVKNFDSSSIKSDYIEKSSVGTTSSPYEMHGIRKEKHIFTLSS